MTKQDRRKPSSRPLSSRAVTIPSAAAGAQGAGIGKVGEGNPRFLLHIVLLCCAAYFLPVGCGGDSPIAPTPTTDVPLVPIRYDFRGWVKALKAREWDHYMEALPGVTVTVTDGPDAGLSALTDSDGQFTFEGVSSQNLYLRVEGERLEPREKLVWHRQAVLLGNTWPELAKHFVSIAPVFPHTVVLLEEETWGHWTCYEHMGDEVGVVGVGRPTHSTLLSRAEAIVAQTIVHEFVHARQAFSVEPLRCSGFDEESWKATAEGSAFHEAWEADMNAGRKVPWLDDPQATHYGRLRYENAAEVVANRYSPTDPSDRAVCEPNAPNALYNIQATSRCAWAERFYRGLDRLR